MFHTTNPHQGSFLINGQNSVTSSKSNMISLLCFN